MANYSHNKYNYIATWSQLIALSQWLLFITFKDMGPKFTNSKLVALSKRTQLASWWARRGHMRSSSSNRYIEEDIYCNRDNVDKHVDLDSVEW